MADNIAQTPAVGTPAQPDPAPQTYQHSERILRIAGELGIDASKASAMDSAALRQEIADAQLESQIRSSRRPQPQVQPQQQATQQIQEPDEEFVLPVELQSKLVDVDPAIVEVIKHVGKEAVRGRKTEKELQRLRQEQANRELQSRTAAEIDKLPATGGSREARHRAIFRELADLEVAGELQGMTVAQAVQLAHTNLYGSAQSTPAPAAAQTPAAPQRRPATPTARPTNRLDQNLQGQLDHLNGNTAEDFVP